MTHPFGAACFADGAWHGTVEIRENVRLARDTYRVRFDCPELARRIVPGQFLMLRLSGSHDPLLGRPLALYETVMGADGRAEAVDVVYLVVGNLTGKLAAMVKAAKVRDWVSLHVRKARQYRPENPDLPTLQPWLNTTKPPSQQFIFARNPFYHRTDKSG